MTSSSASGGDPPWWSAGSPPPTWAPAQPVLRYSLSQDLTRHPLQVAVLGARLPGWGVLGTGSGLAAAPPPAPPPAPSGPGFGGASGSASVTTIAGEVSVTVRVVARGGGEPVLGVRVGSRASSTTMTAASNNGDVLVAWAGEVLVLPVAIAELDADAVVEFSVWVGGDGELLGRAFCPVFCDGTGRMRRGRQELSVYEGEPAWPLSDASRGALAEVFEREEELRKSAVEESPWLRRMAEQRLLEVRRARAALAVGCNPPVRGVLAVEFPDYDGVPILFNVTGPAPPTVNFSHKLLMDESQLFPWKSFSVVFSDPRASSSLANPVEEKYSRLSRSLDRLLTVHEPPNTEERARIERALQSTDTRPRNREEADLLWKFRNSLTHNPRALTKFLASVDWAADFQVQQAVHLMGKWSPIDVADALRLLSGQAEFAHPRVRELAVESLARSGDDRLYRYLPQLVQALRYDTAIIPAAAASVVVVVGGGPTPPTTAASMTSSSVSGSGGGGGGSPPPLARFLISRAVRNPELATMLYWHLKVELAREREMSAMGTNNSPFARVFSTFMTELGVRHDAIKKCIDAQEVFVHSLMGCVTFANALKGNKDFRSKRLREALDGLHLPWAQITLPLYPGLRVVGFATTASARIMPSTTYPAVVTLAVTPDSTTTQSSPLSGEVDALQQQQQQVHPPHREFVAMFKAGDDLRQDQLVIQLLELMDTIFKDVGLNLEMTRYRALATGPTEGLVEFVADALPISKVKKDHGGIPQFLARDAPSYGGLVRVLDRFVRSSAGYAVSTYVLGVGDRHLDNILVRPNGQLFHVDFAWVFGRDKRGASPVRLTEEMIEAMGGRNSSGFRAFRVHACEAYKALRAQSNLLISVVSLMADAGLSDLSVNQHAHQAIEGIKARLQLAQVSDDKAEERLLAVIDESVDALGPIVIEMFHTLAQGLG